ncbi:MAG: heparinase II/III family protein, partial [Acidobacteria bacterium]|nr:heparinase II/III family protein [Acidobacteriota bacterium]
MVTDCPYRHSRRLAAACRRGDRQADGEGTGPCYKSRHKLDLHMSNLLPPVGRTPAIHGVGSGDRQGELPVCDTLGSPMARFLALLLLAGGIYAAEWKDLVRRDHPRLFLNRDTLPLVKARALGEEREAFQAMRSRADALAAGGLASRDYGVGAAEAAFVFLVTGEARYRDLGAALLEASIRYYDECFAAQREVSWYSDSRINAWAAYDWLFNDLPAERRKRMGAALLEATQNEQPTRSRKPFPRENWIGPISGFYSTQSIVWYAGLATCREGIDDERADRFLTGGYRMYLELLQYRSRAAGDDGGSASGALNYCLAAYPWAEFNFFHTYLSATGHDIAREWPYVAWLANYIFWNWLPDAREFGYGDAYHTANRMPLGELNLHLTQLIQFYAQSRPEAAALAKWLSEKAPREKRSSFPFTRFLLTSVPNVKAAQDPGARMSLARHFENMGQIFMRSGSGPEDTYALFTAGGVLEMHKHFDHNNFVIYKKGFLALDTGTRPEPGQHLMNYYSRTVAHNCLLIHMPDERMPRYWGNPAPDEEPLPPPNDGGQRKDRG